MNPRDDVACPFVGMLLNTKRIPHKNISRETFMKAISDLNIFDESMLFLIQSGILKPFLDSNGNIGNITDINNAEHDISLSRLDSCNGNSIIFNQEHFCKLLEISADSIYLTLDDIVKFRKKILRESIKPKFDIREKFISSGEDAFLQLLFSDHTGKIRVDWLQYFFKKAKLPNKKLGYKRRKISAIDFIATVLIHFIKLQ